MKKRKIEKSISPTFYAQLFRIKALPATFLCLHFRFVLFGAKAALKMLVKLTRGDLKAMIKISHFANHENIRSIVLPFEIKKKTEKT